MNALPAINFGSKSRFSILWLFATLNYMYCDVLQLMDPHQLRGFLAGNVGGFSIGQGFLLAAGALVEIPIAMVVLSLVLGHRANRWANIGAGVFMSLVQLATLAGRASALYYVFFSVIEIGTTVAIVWLAWSWTREMPRTR